MIRKIKFPKKYGYLVSAVLMPLSVSLGGTFFHAAASSGIALTADFFSTWLSSWYHAYAVALPVSLASAPLIRRIVESVTH